MKKGFALVELLIAVTIIAVLSVIGVSGYRGVQEKARDGVRKQDLNILTAALEIYAQKAADGKYFITAQSNCNESDTLAFYNSTIKDDLGSKKVPEDPNGGKYCYFSENNGKSFRLFAKLENCNQSGSNFICAYQNWNYSVYSADLTLTAAPSDIAYYCNSQPVCSGSCTATCSGVSGTQNQCNYTASFDGRICAQAAAPDQSCSGTIGASCPIAATVTCGTAISSTSGCGTCTGTGTMCAARANCVGTICIVPPSVTTDAASGITSSQATLNGRANPNGASSSGWFRYSSVNPGSCNDTFGTRVLATGGTNLGSGTTNVSYSESISGLSSVTTYYFCAIASNNGGVSFGPILTFTTACVTSIWYRDGDNDGFGNPSSTTSSCVKPAGYIADNTDCYDSNANAKPGQTSYFTTSRGDGSYDYDCNRTADKRYSITTLPAAACYSNLPSGSGGFAGSPPACGVSGSFLRCRAYSNSACGSSCSTWAGSCPATCSDGGGSPAISWQINSPSVTQACR